MCASRSLALWRLVRAVPRIASLAKANCPHRLALTTLSTPTRTFMYSGQRLLSSQTNSDHPGPGSTSHPEQESNTAQSVSSDSDISVTESDNISSNPEVTTSDPDDKPTDPEDTSDSEMTSDSDSELTSDSDSDMTSETASDHDESRSAILESAMHHVLSQGWTTAALEEGAKDMSLTENIDDLFPRGGGELVDHFEIQCNSDLLEYMKQRVEQENVKGSDLLKEAVEHRLRMIIPYVNKWPQAMALKAFPTNAPTALENLALMVDDIWYYAGDRSTDFNWYTRRALLATIYSSTEVFLVQDTSPDFQETWSFLQRRMKDANNFSKASKELQGVVSGGVEMLTAGLNTALNVLGMNSRNR